MPRGSTTGKRSQSRKAQSANVAQPAAPEVERDEQGNYAIPSVSEFEYRKQLAEVQNWERDTGMSIDDEPAPDPTTVEV